MSSAPSSSDAQSLDSSKFGALFEDVAPALHLWAVLRVRRSLQGVLEPEDLVQEVCFRAYRKFSAFDPARGSFRRWLFGVANFVLKEILADATRRGRRAARPDDSSRDRVAEIPADVTSVSRRVARDENLAAFIVQLGVLEEDDRRLLIYRGLEGLSHTEAAHLLGISADACEKRWQRLITRVTKLGPPPLFVE